LAQIDESGQLLAACDEEYFDEIYLERLIRYWALTRYRYHTGVPNYMCFLQNYSKFDYFPA
jgi:hypothetical protein